MALKLSPNRAEWAVWGRAARLRGGEKEKAGMYYAELMRTTGGGAGSSRAELVHAKSFVEAGQVAAR